MMFGRLRAPRIRVHVACRDAIAAPATRLLALILLLPLAACVTVPPPSVSVDEIASSELVGSEVEGEQVIASWPDQEQAYLASGKADPDVVKRLPTEAASNFPVLQAQFRAALQPRFQAALAQTVAPAMQGAHPVRAVMKLQRFDVPGGARRVLVNGNVTMRAVIDLVDAKSGAVLVSYPGPLFVRDIGGALLGGVIHGVVTAAVVGAIDKDEPGTMMINAYVTDYRKWLLER